MGKRTVIHPEACDTCWGANAGKGDKSRKMNSATLLIWLLLQSTTENIKKTRLPKCKSTNSIESLPSKKQKRATMWVLVKKSVKSVNGSGMLFDFKIGSWNYGTIVYPYIPVPKTKFFTTLEAIRVYRQSREWWLHAFYRKTWWKGREKIILFRWRWKK